MTTGIAAIYIVLMVLGLVWVIARMVSYVRNQRQVESRWSEAMYDEGFKAYLEKLKEQGPEASDAHPSEEENEKNHVDKTSPGSATD